MLFLEGVVTFISPCLLPLLPVYISYFAGKNGRPLVNSIGFVLGFTIVFVTMGAFAGLAGGFLTLHRTTINIVTGLVFVVIGLGYLGFFSYFSYFSFLPRLALPKLRVQSTAIPSTFPSAVIFGIILSISWTPCVSAFLGAALLRASQQGTAVEGMLMLFVYSMGLGLPFIASAVLIYRLKDAFDFIKRNYKVVNALAGCLLIVGGLLMMGVLV